MALEREALTHKIEDDLALRNRNWDKLTSHLADIANSGMQTVTQTAVTGTVQYGKSYGTGVVRIEHSTLTNELGESYGSVTIFTLPAGFRPIAEVWMPLQFDNNSAAAVMRVYPSGLVQIASRQGDPIPTNIAFRGSIVFPIA
jgi:hypothetical protein